MQAAAELDQRDNQQDQGGGDAAGVESCCEKLDEACLLLCIALLDHPLHSNIYNSVIVGFLAVLGINKQKKGLLS